MTCKECGRKYLSKNSSSKYCSKPCVWKNNGKSRAKKPETWWKDRKGYTVGLVLLDTGERIRVRQHRWVVERHLGRKLLPNEDVHHKDGNRSNNDISNLEVMDRHDHMVLTNNSREYKKGYKLKLTPEQYEHRRQVLIRARRKQIDEFKPKKCLHCDGINLARGLCRKHYTLFYNRSMRKRYADNGQPQKAQS